MSIHFLKNCRVLTQGPWTNNAFACKRENTQLACTPGVGAGCLWLWGRTDAGYRHTLFSTVSKSAICVIAVLSKTHRPAQSPVSAVNCAWNGSLVSRPLAFCVPPITAQWAPSHQPPSLLAYDLISFPFFLFWEYFWNLMQIKCGWQCHRCRRDTEKIANWYKGQPFRVLVS